MDKQFCLRTPGVTVGKLPRPMNLRNLQKKKKNAACAIKKHSPQKVNGIYFFKNSLSPNFSVAFRRKRLHHQPEVFLIASPQLLSLLEVFSFFAFLVFP